MNQTIGSAILMIGLLTLVGAQVLAFLHAFTGNPIKGILCLMVPFYIVVYARRHAVGVWVMRLWIAGITLLIIGGVMTS